MIIRDQINSEVTFEAPPARIISLVPSLTELLSDLGLGKKIIGVTKFCIHPDEIQSSACIIGGTKKINLERCTELNPDFVLASKEENVKHQVDFFQKKGISVYTSDIKKIEDVKSLVYDLGEIFQIRDASKTFNDHLEKAEGQLKKNNLKVSKRAIYLIWKNPYMAAGGDTFISSMMNLIGLRNVLEEKKRYPVVSEEELPSMNVDIILLSSEPYPFDNSHLRELHRVTSKKIILVDGEFFSWYGSRILHKLSYLDELTSQL